MGCINENHKLNKTHLVQEKPDLPIPTVVFENMADEKAYEERRDAYFDLIHSGSHNANWKEINAKNFKELAEKRAQRKQYRIVESFLDGELNGEWKERGSVDVPGNIKVSDYHKSTEDIYVISDGGILWKGNLDGETWTPLNDDIQFSTRVLKVVDLPDGGLRIIVADGCELFYSDDEGTSWLQADGISGISGEGINIGTLNNEDSGIVYLYNQRNPISGASVNKLAYSSDFGATFEFVFELNSTNDRFASMDIPLNGDKAYILDENEFLYSFDGVDFLVEGEALDLDGSSRCMIQANNSGGILTLYALFDNEKLYKSTDEGESFSFVNNLPTQSWDVGFEVANDDPNFIYYGEVNLYRSTNGGLTFDLVSEWWEYYDDVANKIHADIMSIEPFVKEDGTEFTLIANHGGISVSYDHLATTPNIALQDLNTGQFYDVLTHPDNGALIFGGTQDQGFQRTLDGLNEEPSSFQQVISGDYGEMQFTNDAETIWIQYPGGDFQIYTDAESHDWYSHSYNVNGVDMPNNNWIVPTGAAPFPSDNFIYVGGGNISGGSGSRLIKLTYTGSDVTASQFSFDFKDHSGASISAIETSPLMPECIYVVTENGRFYSSYDTGENFTQTEDYIGPSGGWIYTADIYASRKTPGLIFVGGSGYAGASVYMSKDSAKTFIPLDGDMPNTMVHEMTMDPNENYLFAATDAGPYVYSMNSEEWYNIAGLSAPLQQYISVEFVPSEYIVRFATWGRGIWDFNLTTSASIQEEHQSNKLFNVYPNPSSTGEITIEGESGFSYQLYNLNGKLIKSFSTKDILTLLQVDFLENGTYILVGNSPENETAIQKIIIAK